jgi:hypothetical protein
MEVNEAPSPPMTQTKPTWQTHALSPNGRSTSSRSRNATAGPSGTRHSDKPREVVKIEGDDSDDDFKMLDEPPEVFSRSATALFKREIATEEERYPTPPQTPLEQNDDILGFPDYGAQDLSMTPSAGEATLDEDDDAPLHRSGVRHLPFDLPVDLTNDPIKKEKTTQDNVPPRVQDRFLLMEKELHKWSEQGFKGTIKSFLERMTINVRGFNLVAK